MKQQIWLNVQPSYLRGPHSSKQEDHHLPAATLHNQRYLSPKLRVSADKTNVSWAEQHCPLNHYAGEVAPTSIYNALDLVLEKYSILYLFVTNRGLRKKCFINFK